MDVDEVAVELVALPDLHRRVPRSGSKDPGSPVHARNRVPKRKVSKTLFRQN